MSYTHISEHSSTDKIFSLVASPNTLKNSARSCNSSSGGTGSAGASSGSAALPDGTESQDEGTYILADNRSYLLTGETVWELPQGAQELGVLSAAEDGAPSPSTNGADYVGCVSCATVD